MRTRTLHTKIWEDSWFSTLSASEKLLFIYFLTNSHINLCGIYEISSRLVCFETGVTPDQLQKIQLKLSDKIMFIGDWVVIRNIGKYDNFSGGKLNSAKDKQLNEVPEFVLNTLSGSIDRVSIGYRYPMDTSNSTSNSNNKEESVRETKKLHKTPEYLENVPAEDIASLRSGLVVNEQQIRSKAEDVYNWYLSNPQKNKRADYKAILRNSLKRDYPAQERRMIYHAKTN